MTGWNGLWLTAAFVSEVAALVALGYWGFTQPSAVALRVVVGIGAPVLAAVLWGLFAAPKARFRVPALAVAVKVVVFGAAVLALVDTGHPWLALALGVVALLGAVLSTPLPT